MGLRVFYRILDNRLKVQSSPLWKLRGISVNGQADFGKKVTVTISRNGDLITRIYLVVDLPEVTAAQQGETVEWTRNLGHIMIKQVEVEIGGQRIDRQFGEWLVIYAELTLQAGHVVGYAEMIGNTGDLFLPAPNAAFAALPAKRLYVPLQFWFNRNPGLALPLIALQYHEVKIHLEFRPLNELLIVRGDEAEKIPLDVTVSLQSASLWVDYVYLDTDERRRFAQVSHEYLIEQLQFTGEETITGANNKIRLNFNHPVKELIWVSRLEDAEEQCQWSNFTDGVTVGGANPDAYAGGNPLIDAKLQLNGHDRFATRMARYFNLVQPYQHHTNIPATGIYVYSFGLKPEEHQPSGSANLSRIDNATFQMSFAPALFTQEIFDGKTIKVLIFAVNYNVLRIMSGILKMFRKFIKEIFLYYYLSQTVSCHIPYTQQVYGQTV